MNRKFPSLLFPFVLLTMMCICPNFDTEKFAKTEPTIDDISGKYVPTSETLKNITEEGQYTVNDMFILLWPNGSFEMQNMPDWWLTHFGKSQGCLIVGQGNWEIVKQQNWWELRLDFLSGKDLCVEEFSAGFTISIPLVGDSAPHSLWFYVGDPDTGHIMIFEKALK